MDTIDESELHGCMWTLRHSGGEISTDSLQLLPGGSVEGYHHPNEAAWRCENGILEFLNLDSQVSSRFTTIERSGNLLSRMTGSFLLHPELGITFVLERRDTGKLRTLPTGTKANLGQQITDLGWEIGEHSYGVPFVYAINSENRLKIGRFCSIGHDVTIVLVNHRSDFVTTYPFATYRHVWPEAPMLQDYVGRGDVVIGNDVWIGHGVFIGSGVTVGDGAIVGGHAVVTKDVPPYAVVVGNPSKVIRYRFDAATIESLLEIKWWDWSDTRLEKGLPLLMSGDVHAFIEAARRTETGRH